MISVNSISIQFGGRYLFKNISFRIGPHDRIGLVGSNGAGKSTLLKVLTGSEDFEGGQVDKAKYVNVGYLPQEGMHVEGRSLYAEVESTFGDVIDMQARLEEVHEQMGAITDHTSDEFNELLEIYGELQHRLEDSDVFRMKSKIEKVLVGLGFTQSDMTRGTDEFSGGWQMRIALAKLLLQQPSLLLLDEPTNHLDLDSLTWLEEYLRSYDGAVMIVSHDRRFLDEMTKKTYELSMGEFTEYSGNYTFFVNAKAERREIQFAAMKNQQQQIKQTERFIERFRYKATKARQVQSRIKQLDKIERIEIEDEENAINFEFPKAPQGGAVAMDLQNIYKSYGDLVIFDGLNYAVERGQKIAFVGVNGAGKSTLARIIAGVEPFNGGTRRLGHKTIIGYFAQHQAEELNPEFDVLQTVEAIAAGETRVKLRTLLGCFLFSGDDVFKLVSVLSGGEKSRLALAKMLLQPANLIVLDEPTNHLDMRSKTILQEALMDFEGSAVIVSHDRDFLDPIVDHVVEFKHGEIKSFTGNVSEFLEWRQRLQLAKAESSSTQPSTKSTDTTVTDKERKRLEAEQRQERYRRTKPVKDKIEKVEKKIETLETEKADIEASMAEPDFYKDGEKAKSTSYRYKEIDKELNDLYHRWNELTKEVDRLA